MAYFHFECFCNLTYDKELTYEEVLEREEQLKLSIERLLSESEAVHIDFVPLSDNLQVQCAFVDLSPVNWQELCADMAQLAVSGIQGRMVLLDRNLDEMQICFLAAGKPTLARLPLPEPHIVQSTRKLDINIL
ncbi:MAG: hypothetical protein RRY20_06320 [Bilophila sp.]